MSRIGENERGELAADETRMKPGFHEVPHIVNRCFSWVSSVMKVVLLVGLLSGLRPAFSDDRTERDKQIDAAISKALEHLAKKQQPSGAWVLDQFGESTSSTSLAVMAFLAAGHVPGEGLYGAKIEQGVKWVLDQQQANGMLVKERGHGPMYSHGISTLMLAEVAGMTDDALAGRCRDALKKSVRLILAAQSVRKDHGSQGGWRYLPSSNDSDLSVTGWQLLSLRAAKNLGCDVPAENIDAAVEYVKRLSVRNRGFGYQNGSGSSPTRGDRHPVPGNLWSASLARSGRCRRLLAAGSAESRSRVVLLRSLLLHDRHVSSRWTSLGARQEPPDPAAAEPPGGRWQLVRSPRPGTQSRNRLRYEPRGARAVGRVPVSADLPAIVGVHSKR